MCFCYFSLVGRGGRVLGMLLACYCVFGCCCFAGFTCVVTGPVLLARAVSAVLWLCYVCSRCRVLLGGVCFSVFLLWCGLYRVLSGDRRPAEYSAWSR